MAFGVKRDIHKVVIENLSAYIDGETDAKTTAMVEQHLAHCDSCAWEKRTLEQTRTLVMQAPRVAVPRSFVIREADVRPAPRAKASLARGMLYLRTAAASVAVLLFATLAGDAWVRPMLGTAAQPQPLMAPQVAPTVAPQPEGTFGLKATGPAAQEAPTGTPPPAGTVAIAAAAAADETADARAGGGAEDGTPQVLGSATDVQERGEARLPFWAQPVLWRAVEGALGLAFVALMGTIVVGMRRTARDT